MDRQIAGRDVQVGPAHAARGDSDEHVACAGNGFRPPHHRQRPVVDRSGLLDDPCIHRLIHCRHARSLLDRAANTPGCTSW
jgi:hypothetical protein